MAALFCCQPLGATEGVMDIALLNGQQNRKAHQEAPERR